MIILQGLICCRFFSFRTFWVYHAIPFWVSAYRVSAENSSDSFMVILLNMTLWFSLAAFRLLSLSLIFATLITICVGVGLFAFIFKGTLCASCTWISVSFFWFGKFLALISSDTFSVPFYFSSSWTPELWILLMKNCQEVLASFRKQYFSQ